MATKNHHLSKSELVAAMPLACSDEKAALAFFEQQRWGDCPCCVHCGSVDVYTIKDRKTGERRTDGRWRCRDCGKQYTVRVGQILEDSPIPLTKWAHAFWAAATCKNGISALELMRRIQVSYKTALFIMNRIRWAMAHDPNRDPKLTGTVEADETYVGGKPRSAQRPWRRGMIRTPRRKWSTKTPVFAAVQRGGEVRVRVIPTVNSANLRDALLDNVNPQATKLYTDECYSYRMVGRKFPQGHEHVNHSVQEYVRGDVHTNTVEGFFSRIKRKIGGTHHAVSKTHLHRYVGEAAYLYNARHLNDGERIADLVKAADGKRLVYREPESRAG